MGDKRSLVELLAREAIRCPVCLSTTISARVLTFCCGDCGWTSPLVEGDTPSFAERVYEEAKARTTGCGRVSTFRRLCRLYRRVNEASLPWGRWLRQEGRFSRQEVPQLRRREMKTLDALLGTVAPGRRRMLLELGVGGQDHTEFYRRRAEYTVCSDIYRDEQTVRRFADRPDVLFAVMNVEKLPFRSSVVDVALTSHVVEHFPNRERNLRELRRVLKPGGLACHVVPVAVGHVLAHVWGTVLNFATLMPKPGRGVHGEYSSSIEELRRTTRVRWRGLFEGSGFDVLASAPGVLGLSPLPARLTMRIAKVFGLYGSWVFLTRANK